jgi:hypothetical protein
LVLSKPVRLLLLETLIAEKGGLSRFILVLLVKSAGGF